jgi:hypothetical protein
MRTSYSRRELYALGEPLGDSATYLKADGGLILGDGGGGGGSQPASSTTQTQDLPDWAKPYAQDVLSKGKAVTDLDQNPYQPYGGNRIAGFDPMQQQAFQGAQNMRVAPQIGQATAASVGAGLGGFDVAGQANQYGFQNQVGGYMNPYLQMSLAPQIAEANRQYDITGTKQQSAATQAGAFGGSREAIMAAENERNRNMGINQIVGQGYNTAFTNAQNQYNQNLQNQLAGYGMANQAAGQLGNLGQSQYQQGMGINALQAQYGAQQQAQQQRGLDTAYQDFLTQKNYPYQQLSYMSNLVRGTPMGMNTASQVYQAPPNTMGQLAGLGLGAYGVSQLMKADGGQVHSYADGGAVQGYKLGGNIPDPMNDPYEMASAVDGLTDEQLQGILQHPSSPAEFRAAQDEMAMRASEDRGVASGIPSSMVKRIANGGIIAFKERGYVEGEEEEESKSGIGALPYLAGAAPLLKEVPVSKIVKGSLKGTGKALSGLRSAASVAAVPGVSIPLTGGLALSEGAANALSNATPEQLEQMEGFGGDPSGTSFAAAIMGQAKKNQTKKDVFKNLGATDASLGGAGVENALNAVQKAKAKAKPTGGGGTKVSSGGAGQTASGGAGDFESDMARIQGFMKDPEAEAANKRLQDLIDKQGSRADQVKKDALANLLITGGFGLAQAASQPQSQRGLAGVLQSAAKAAPGVGQAALGMQKDIAAIQDNNLKLNLEHQKYKIAERRGDRAAMMSAYQNMRMLKQHEATLGETIRSNKAREGILAQRASAASNPGIKAYYSGQAQARNLASREATKQWENIADRKALEKQGITSYDQLFNQRLKQHMKSAMPIYGVRPDTEDDEG